MKLKQENYEVNAMKKKDEKSVLNSDSRSSVCHIVDEAVEQWRKNKDRFDIEKFISKYKPMDKESEEAITEELVDALILDDLFSEFRELKHHMSGFREQDI